MFDFYEKRKLKGLIYTKVTAIIILIIAGLISVSVYERYKVERDVATKKDETLKELRELEEKVSTLESEVRRLKSDRGIEEEIRDRFEVAKEGEQVVVIVGSDEEDNNPEIEEVVNRERSWFEVLKFWD